VRTSRRRRATSGSSPPQAPRSTVRTLANVSDPDRDALQVISASDPASGEVDAEPGGTLRFDPVQPGLERLSYQVAGGRGGTDTGEVTAFVNPVAPELDRPVLEG
jgi:hypothetical protein